MVETVEIVMLEAKVGNLRVAAGTTGLTGDSGSSVRSFIELENDVEEPPPIPPGGKVRKFEFYRGAKSRSFIELRAQPPGTNFIFQVDKLGKRLQIAMAGDKELQEIAAALEFIVKTLQEKMNPRG
jgi:hypothetical protein